VDGQPVSRAFDAHHIRVPSGTLYGFRQPRIRAAPKVQDKIGRVLPDREATWQLGLFSSLSY
jgi:hypothetical protein